MNDLLVGLLSVLLSTNQVTTSNLLRLVTPTAQRPSSADLQNPAYLDLKRVMELDDKARGEIDALLEAEDARVKKAPEIKPLSTDALIEGKLGPVRQAYEDLVAKHPRYSKARVAYGSFLNEVSDENAAVVQWRRANELDPADSAAWNNLGDYYGHHGPVTNAFFHYAKAIELAPGESSYYKNLATVVYLFRDEASRLFKTNQLGVLNRAMALYRKAFELDPGNFILAAELAQSYYGFPAVKSADAQADRRVIELRAAEALGAWTNAFRIARDDIERQGVQLHMARWTMNIGRFEASRGALGSVTNSMFDLTKDALLKKLARLQSAESSGGAPAVPETKGVKP